MKFITKTLAASALVIAIAAPAIAAPVSSVSDFRRDIRTAAGPSSNVTVVIRGDTVTLYGFVEGSQDLNRVNQVARKSGYTDIRNSIVRSD